MYRCWQIVFGHAQVLSKLEAVMAAGGGLDAVTDNAVSVASTAATIECLKMERFDFFHGIPSSAVVFWPLSRLTFDQTWAVHRR